MPSFPTGRPTGVAAFRVGSALAVGFYVWSYAAPAGAQVPEHVVPISWGLVAVLLALAVAQVTTRWGNENPALFLALDVAIAVVFTFLYAFDPRRHLVALLFGVIAEGGYLFGMRGALTTWAVCVAALAGRELVAGAAQDEGGAAGTAVRGLVGLGLAMVIGSLSVAGSAAKALAHERAAAEDLRALDDVKNTFLHALSHDLKNPIAVIKTGSELLDEAKLSDEQRAALIRSIRNSAQRLERLLTDLLDLRRLEQGMVEPVRSRTDVTGLARTLIQALQITSHPVEVTPHEVMANVDAAKVERIVENLVLNAVKHTAPGTPISVAVKRQPPGVLLRVEDAGPGVPDDIKSSIFVPFLRGSTSASGTGIGLSLVEKFAELHRGRAWVEDRPGGGAAFNVLLAD